MNNETAALLATATARAEAHNGLADALEYGYVSSLRVQGVMRLTARGHFGTFLITFDNNSGAATCNGYRLVGSAAPLALEALREARARGPHARS